MKLYVSRSNLNGSLAVPGSKSHTIRAIAIAMLAKGASIIKAPLISEDTVSSLGAASTLGAWVKRGDDSIWRIAGTNGNLLEPAFAVDLGNSGTGVKLFAALASLASFPVRFDGDESLRSRPMQPLLDALVPLGVKCESTDGKCPFSVQGPLSGGETEVEGKSSQYLSALLLAAPYAKNDTTINVHALNEIPYVDITLDWLKRQEIDVKHDSAYSRFVVRGRQSYRSFTAKIPGDFSSAAFPLVAAAVTGGKVKIENLDFNDPQGDKVVFKYLEKMGVSIDYGADYAIVKGGKLKAVELDLNATPDALPILCIAAACAKGKSVFKNVAQARIKETDRIACMARELRKMSIEVEEFEDGLAITGGKLKAATVESYKDHRIAMSFAIAGLVAEPDQKGDDTTVVLDSESIAVTYPSFVEDFKNLGAVFYEI